VIAQLNARIARLAVTVDSRAQALGWLNWLHLAARQWRQHAVNALALAVLLTFVRPATLPQPLAWLSAYRWLLLPLLGLAWFNLARHLTQLSAHQRTDWLAALPIAPQHRLNHMRWRAAWRSAFELALYAFLAYWAFGAKPAAAFALAGAALCATWLRVQPAAPGMQARQLAAASVRATPRPGVLDPLAALFAGAKPTAAQFRWWWLLPMLALPMGAAPALLGVVALCFWAITELAALHTALAVGLMQLTQLTRAMPITPRRIYAIALGIAVGVAKRPPERSFVALRAISVLILCQIGACVYLGLGVAQIGIISAGIAALCLIVLLNQLHLAFAYRFAPLPSMARWRAGLILTLVVALCVNFPPALPLVCAGAWRWLYRKGERF
jgi:hypothetical protein